MRRRYRMREVKLVRAREDHICMFCRGKIAKGDICYRFIETSPGRFTRIYGHKRCVEEYRRELERWRGSKRSRTSSARR